MTLYQRIDLSGPTAVGNPGPLPAELVGLADESLADIPAAIKPTPKGYENTGFLPVPPPPVEPPEPQPRIIGKGTFLDLLQSDGGLTDAKLLQAKADAKLAALWLKLDLYSEVRIDHPGTQGGLDALVALGYMTAAGRQAVINAWPTT